MDAGGRAKPGAFAEKGGDEGQVVCIFILLESLSVWSQDHVNSQPNPSI